MYLQALAFNVFIGEMELMDYLKLLMMRNRAQTAYPLLMMNNSGNVITQNVQAKSIIIMTASNGKERESKRYHNTSNSDNNNNFHIQ